MVDHSDKLRQTNLATGFPSKERRIVISKFWVSFCTTQSKTVDVPLLFIMKIEYEEPNLKRIKMQILSLTELT